MTAFFVSLPEPLQLAIGVLVAFVVDFLLQQVVAFWPWLAEYLGQYRDQIVASASAALVAYAGQLLALIPSQYEAIVNAALVLLVAILALFGIPFLTARYARARAWRGFKK